MPIIEFTSTGTLEFLLGGRFAPSAHTQYSNGKQNTSKAALRCNNRQPFTVCPLATTSIALLRVRRINLTTIDIWCYSH